MGIKRPSRHKEAFLEGLNTVGLASAVALSAALLNPLPLLAALVVEAVYLLFVPDSKWYENRLAAKYDNEVLERRRRLRDQVYPALSDTMKGRFSRLEVLRDQIGNQQVDGRLIYREVLRRLDYLMEKFLLFASKEVEFKKYLRTIRNEISPGQAPPRRIKKHGGAEVPFEFMDEPESWVKQTTQLIADHYQGEIEEIGEERQADENLHNQAILDKRTEVLMRRSQYVMKIGDILVNVNHQLNLMEDTFGLINDEIRARSPEQVLADIDSVVYQSDTLAMSLQEVAPFDTMPLEFGANKLYDAPKER